MATTPAVQTPLLSSLNIPQRRNFLQYAKRFAEASATELGSFRNLLEFRDRAYQMQLDQSRDKYVEIQKWLQADSKRQVQHLDVPIVMPQIESAVAYQVGVYLSSYPIFGVISTNKNMDAAMQFETVIGQHSIQYGWARELIKVFRNGFKHNFAPAFVHWKRQIVQHITTSTDNATAGMAQLKAEVTGGNCIEAIDVYNCFFDFRVLPAKHHEEGEAFGWNKLMTRMAFKRFCNSLDPARTTSFKEAFESSYSGGSDSNNVFGIYVPKINPSLQINSNVQTGTNWMQWAGLSPGNVDGNGMRINYRDSYVVTFFVCRALPSDFGKQGETPTIYFGIIVNWRVVIYVEEIISAHDYLPVFIMQPNEDDLGYQTQSMLDTALPFQDMSTALWNISLESKRRLVFDRLIYNSRLINKNDIDPASAVARIPLRNVALMKGETIQQAIYQIPYREDNSGSNIEMSERISQMADVAAGQNKVTRGQFQKGNKTKTEFTETMGNQEARPQLVSMTIEHQFMVPTKETIKANTILNQKPGTFLNRDKKQEVDVNPTKFRDQILDFKMTDGLLPASKILNTELMTVFIQTASAMPVVMSEYDIMGMFIYWAKLQGAYWIEDFKRDPAQQQQFMDLYKQTSAAENTQPPEQQQPAGAPA